MWVKICANTTLEDARFAASAGADAVGFVFAPSPRRVTVQHVREIALRLPANVEKVGVFGGAAADSLFDEIVDAVVNAGLTGVQLHGPEDATLRAQLRARLQQSHPALRIIQTLSIDAAADGPSQPAPGKTPLSESFRKLVIDASLDAVLVDSRTAKASGGTGVAFDWAAAKDSFGEAEGRKRVIVAGGLNPGNVAEAIRTLQPWGVDVASGVEASPGKKDPAKVTAFLEAARAASAGMAAAE